LRRGCRDESLIHRSREYDTRSDHERPSSTTTPTLNSCEEPAAAVPTLAGFQVSSWTFISPDDGWALGTKAAGDGLGCAVIAHTSKGGSSWSPAPSLSGSGTAPFPVEASEGAQCPTDSCVSGLRFANASDGYAFGPDFYTTNNGGVTWRQSSAPTVVALEAADDHVVRVVSPCGAGDQCNMLVQSSIAGTKTWTTLDAPQEQWDHLVLVGPATIYLAGTPPDGFPGTDLWRSTNGGVTWSQLGNPCAEVPLLNPGGPSTTEGRGQGIAAFGTALAVACVSGQIAPQQAGYEQGVVLSDDGGDSFGQFLPIPHLPGLDCGSGVVGIALTSPDTVVVVGSEGGVQTSVNGGKTWATTIPQLTDYGGQTAAGPIGFENSSTGHVVTPSDTFWTTSNGGETWSAYRFPS
jgi:photosystem II stability/assembly factor-like uncharacterized protein